MKTKVVNINPKLPYNFVNLEKNKVTTIRDKNIEIGTPVALWLKWRGMTKGLYCTGCWKQVEIPVSKASCIFCNDEIKERIQLPKLLKRSVITSCIKSTFSYSDNFVCIKQGKNGWWDVEYSDIADQFVIDEGFSSNKKWISAMLKLDKKLEKGETVTKYLWRF